MQKDDLRYLEESEELPLHLKDTARAVRLLAGTLILTGLTSALLLLLRYHLQGEWQSLLTAGLFLVGLLSVTLARRQGEGWLLGGILIPALGTLLLWSGADWQIGGSALVLILLIDILTPPQRRHLWGLSLLLLLGWLVLVRLSPPLPRYPILEPLAAYLPLFFTVVVMLALALRIRRLERWTQELDGARQQSQERNEALNEQLAELSLLHTIATAGAKARTEDGLLERVTQTLGEAFAASSFGVLLLDPVAQELYPHPSYRTEIERSELNTVPLGEGLVGRAALQRQTLRADEAHDSTLHASAGLAPRAEIAVPLLCHDKELGVIHLARSPSKPFDEDDEVLLRAYADQIATGIDRLRRMAQSQQRVQQMTMIYDLGSQITSILTPDDLLPAIGRLIAESLGFYNVEIALVEEGELVFHAGYGGYTTANHSIEPGYALKIGHGITGKVAEMGESLLVPDVEQSEEYVSYPLLPDVRSELAVPLKVREKVIGVLDVKSDRAFDLNVQDAALLEILAPQIAIAVQNAQLFEKLQQKTQELSGLYEAALVTSSELNLQPLLHRLYEQIQKLLDPDFFVVALYNGEEVNVVLAIERDKTVPDTVEIPLSLEESGLTGLVIQSRESVYIRDLHNDTLPIKPRYVSRTRSWLGVPLIARGQVIGALSVQSRHPRAYTEAQQRFLESLGGQVAIALENARLFQSTIEVNRRLSILHSTSQEFVTAGVGPEKVYTAIHAAASQLMPCEGFVISLLSSEDEIHAVYLVDKNGRSPARRIPLSQGLSGRIIRTGESLLISEINESADFEAVHFGSSDTTRSALAVPLKLGGKVFGMLSAQSYTPRAYGPEDQRLLEMLASHAAAALENMRLLEAERERRVELEELDELKSEFIQNVSHELRTPLAIVRGYTELLETGDLGELKPEQKGAVDIIARRARMLSSMVSDLIAILETEARQFHYEPVDLVALLQSIVDDFKMNFVEAQLSLEAEIQAEEAFIEGDSVHLRRVCDNLLSNALKFTPAEGQVEVRLHKNTTTVTLEVSDSGIGIPTEKIDRIFERFYQVDGSMTRRYGGTGLGLALVKEVVESHGGQISVESEVGEGTTFCILLPLLDTETDPERSTKRL